MVVSAIRLAAHADSEASFNLWIHDDRFSKADVILNPEIFPDFKKGDIVEIERVSEKKCNQTHKRTGSELKAGLTGSDSYALVVRPRLVLQVPNVDTAKAQQPNLQISIAQHIASAFDLQSRTLVFVKKLDPNSIAADYVELSIRDQYISRSDMWKLTMRLVGCCVYPGKKLAFSDSIRAVAKEIAVANSISRCGYVSPNTKIVFRSESAKCFLFIQVSREMSDFSESGDLHSENLVHGMLPELFNTWKSVGVTHIVNILLFTRVFYPAELSTDCEFADDDTEFNIDSQGRLFQDFYRVLVDWETRSDWSVILYTVKRELLAFQQTVLQRTAKQGSQITCGELSSAQEGNLLEAVNLALNPFDKHYIDRDFSRTGLSIVVITPGPGRFQVDRKLWRLTTERMIDNGIGLDIVSLCRPPLYQVPLFQFFCDVPCEPVQENAQLESGSPVSVSTNFTTTSVGTSGKGSLGPASKSRSISTCAAPKHLSGSFKAPLASSVQSQQPAVDQATAQLKPSFSFGTLDPMYIDDLPDNAAKYSKVLFSALPNWSSCSFWSKKSKSSHKLERTQAFNLRAKMPGVDVLLKEQGSIEMSTQLSFSEFEYILDDVLPGLKGRPSNSWYAHSAVKPKNQFKSVTASHGRASSSPGGTNTSPLGNALSLGSSPPQQLAVAGVADAPSTFYGLSSDVFGDSAAFQIVTFPNLQPTVSYQSRQKYMNPCQPSKSALQSTSGYKRWLHIFSKSMSPELPVAVVKWKAITTPALLPLTTEFFPSPDVLQQYYQEYPYTVSPNDETNAYQDTSPSDQQRIEALLFELISQRLAQGFQLVVGTSAYGLSDGAGGNSDAASEISASLEVPSSSKPLSKQLSVTKPYFLSMGDDVHKLFYDASGQNIEVRRYVRKTSYSKAPIRYKCRLWPKDVPGEYQKRCITFSYPSFSSYNWNYLDHLVSGYQEDMPESLRYWRTRFLLIPAETLPSHNFLVQPHQRNEALDDEELRVAGFYKFLEALEKSRWITQEERAAISVESKQARKASALKAVHSFGISLTTLDTSDYVRRELAQPVYESFLEARNVNMPIQTWMHPSSMLSSGTATTSSSLQSITEYLASPANKFPVKDREWHGRMYHRSFIGSEAVEWFIRMFSDIDSREQAVQFGNYLLQNRVFLHVHQSHSFLDGYYYYHLVTSDTWRPSDDTSLTTDSDSISDGVLSGTAGPPVQTGPNSSGRRSSITWFGRASNLARFSGSNSALSTGLGAKEPERELPRTIILSKKLIVDMDPSQKSSQREKAVLHYDTVYNPRNCFHFQLHWLVCSARLIEDTLQSWARVAEKCGLKLVEAPVEQVKPVSDDNPFQSVVPIKLAVAPPSEQKPSVAPLYYEIELLKAHGFILDMESDSQFVDLPVRHSFPSPPYKNLQFVHKSGAVFVQVPSCGKEFLWVNNRLVLTGLSSVNASGSGNPKVSMANIANPSKSVVEEASPPPLLSQSKQLPPNRFLSSSSFQSSVHPDTLRQSFKDACADRDGLQAFYDFVKKKL